MNIKEAYAKATSGPYYPGLPIRSTDTIGINAMRVIEYDDQEHTEETIAEVLPGCGEEQQKIDAALLAHAYNHLPKVLEALKTYVEADGQADLEEASLFSSDLRKDFLDIIAEASEVKV